MASPKLISPPIGKLYLTLVMPLSFVFVLESIKKPLTRQGLSPSGSPAPTGLAGMANSYSLDPVTLLLDS
ncbi:MAG: hypothetical protein KOO63_11020 [Bacteroidales bacterium]|nr:hypothetical protein [Candidatus Latescibacterota bacterium]